MLGCHAESQVTDIYTSPSQAYYILDEILISGELQVASLSWGTISSSTSLMFFFWGGHFDVAKLQWRGSDSSGWDSLCEESSKRAVLHHISEQEQIAAVVIGGKRNVLAVPSQVKNGQRWTNVVIFFYGSQKSGSKIKQVVSCQGFRRTSRNS